MEINSNALIYKKGLNLSLAVLCSVVIINCSAGGGSSNPNPSQPVKQDEFIKTWKTTNDIYTNTLVITKSPVSGMDYSMNYTSPSGLGNTDMCSRISDIKLSCAYSTFTLVRDPANYSITLSTIGESLTYYEPNHIPTKNPPLGT